ncbi:uncharacterized protein GGS25DRAFT_469995 [Hypoxylon fragiforme]|uniref:uncharacterized protein n=1 Tax=Hypoxylon fragiforme TaxID=63214 RepID=UPI0020C68A66|nr:uncharacterized protein GGS25DRAFT_469995 [Hypoxylon fragiforme]KAI2614020.1 hypothetical protein GGS25DRAFT_469995 [Hypoxylon fragiforme]
MLSKTTTLAVLGLASTAMALNHPNALRSLNSLREEHVVVEVRQAETTESATVTESGASNLACASSALAIITDAPEPPDNLLSYFSSWAQTADLTDPAALCAVTADVPQSLSSDYSAYDQQASSWFAKHSSDVAALASQCGDTEDAASVSQIVYALSAYVGSNCTGTLSTGTATGTAAGASSTQTGAAARPTGFVAGAMAAAGFLGVAAAL